MTNFTAHARQPWQNVAKLH